MLSGKYTFLPWLKQGLSLHSNIIEGTTTNAQERAAVSVDLKLNKDKAGTVSEDVNQTFQIIGPGDVIAFSDKAVIKNYPAKGVPDFQPNYLPYIEFYEEDLPWRYNPAIASAAAGDKLNPWLFLLVLKDNSNNSNDNEFGLDTDPSLPFPTLTVVNPTAVLPSNPETSLWAWSHVHINDEVSSDIEIDAVRNDNPNAIFSRIISPRKLDPNSNYKAFLIPTFETGRQVGLNPKVNFADITPPINAMTPAWTGAEPAGESKEFPVYYQWDFQTGERGDFEEAVQKLKPEPVPDSVGTRNIDPTKAFEFIKNFGNGKISESFSLKIGGALKTPETDFSWPVSSNPTANDEGYIKRHLEKYLNLQEDLKENTVGVFDQPLLDAYAGGDPIITAPLYGRWHALLSRVKYAGLSPSDILGWFNELNIEPRHRIAAGIGTEVVIENQEELMDDAWGQVGEVLRANRLLNISQMSAASSDKMYQKNIPEMPMYVQLGMTKPVQSKMLRKDGKGDRTYTSDLNNSNLPNAITDSAFRKVFRPGGNAAKNLNGKLAGSKEAPFSFDAFFDGMVNDLNDDSPEKEHFSTAPPRKDERPEQGTIDDINKMDSVIKTIEESYKPDGKESNPNYTVPLDYTDPKNPKKISNNVFNLFKAYKGIEIAKKPSLDLAGENGYVNGVVKGIAPEKNIGKAVNRRIGNNKNGIDQSQITPVLAAPEFGTPMYEYLKNISADFILPGINNIQDNVISLVETNPKFIESYMVGLNHEMSRELLWREYPTDQRGTYFKQFWEGINNSPREDITDMHEWVFGKPIGDAHHSPEGETNNLVLLIRGELLRKYPNIVIYAQRARPRPVGSTDARELVDKDNVGTPEIKHPVFQASVDPDIYFLGFDITAEEARGDDGSAGWYFVLRERPGELQFGSDIDSAASLNSWNDLSWNEISLEANSPNIDITQTVGTLTSPNAEDAKAQWGDNAAETAYILHQPPVMVAIHAEKMLNSLTQ